MANFHIRLQQGIPKIEYGHMRSYQARHKYIKNFYLAVSAHINLD